MNTAAFQKEILLVANAVFFRQHWIKTHESHLDKQSTQREKLVDACWNGLAPGLLPECFNATADKCLRLWEARYTGAFICLHFWDGKQLADREFALNPYIFMEAQEYN